MDILVTGAASGIGRATTEKLCENSHNVIAFDIDGKGLEKLPEQVETVQGDTRDEEKVEEVVKQKDFDVLVNCAGFYELGAIEDMERETAEKIFDTNVHGYLNFIRHAMPQLRQKDGLIINVSSVAGRMTLPFYGVYCGSKHAIEAISDALRMEAKNTGVEVVIVEPGPINTGFNQRARQALEKYMPGSIYTDSYRDIKEQESGGATPEEAAEKIVETIEGSRKRRKTVTWIAWLAPKLKRITPRSLWYRIVRSRF